MMAPSVFYAGDDIWLKPDGGILTSPAPADIPNGSRLLIRMGQDKPMPDYVYTEAPSAESGAQYGETAVDGTTGFYYVNVGSVGSNSWKKIAELN